MAKQDETKSKYDNQKENARVGYQVASNLLIYEGSTLWSKFNALLVANSIVLGAILFSTNVSGSLGVLSKVFSIGMPIFGFILCIMWFLLTKRSFNYYKYWILSTRELEEQHLNIPLQTISRGGNFADGKEVKTRIGGNHESLQMSCLSRLSIKYSSYIIIGLFFFMYVAIIIMPILFK